MARRRTAATRVRAAGGLGLHADRAHACRSRDRRRRPRRAALRRDAAPRSATRAASAWSAPSRTAPTTARRCPRRCWRPRRRRRPSASARPSGTPSKASSCCSARAASGLDAERARGLRSPTAATLAYEHLVIATGGRAAAAAAPSRLRERQHAADARGRRAGSATCLRAGARLLIVGAGFIGQEVAAAARGAGAEVDGRRGRAAAAARPARPRDRRAGSPSCTAARASSCVLGADRLPDSRRAARRGRHARRRPPARHATTCWSAIGVVPDLDWLGRPGCRPAGSRPTQAAATELPDVYAAGDAAAGLRPVSGAPRAQRALGGGRASGRSGRQRDPRPPGAGAAACRASGATSTARASSTSATRSWPTRWRSTATPPARDFVAHYTRGRSSSRR